MRWTLSDGTVAENSEAMKRLCAERGIPWEPFKRRAQKGLARRKERRQVRLPDDWRARLDAIFGPNAVFEFVLEIPARRPAIVVTVNATDTKWAQALGHAADVMALVRGRINYIDKATSQQMKGNPRGTIIWLFADDREDVARFNTAMDTPTIALRGIA